MMGSTHRKHGAMVVRNSPPTSALVDVARNRAVNTVSQSATHVLFCDDDMAPEEDALTRLLSWDVPVVTALATTRSIPIDFATRYLHVEGEKVLVSGLDRSQLESKSLISPVVAGAAFLLMKKRVLDQVLQAHLDARDWVLENKDRFERMGIGRGTIEKERLRMAGLRATAYSDHRHHTLFHFPYDQNGVLMYGEDVQLSLFLFSLGIPIHLDPTVHVQHIGEFAYGPQLLGVKSKSELEFTHDDGTSGRRSEQG